MLLAFWQGFTRLVEDLQSNRSLYQTDGAMIRLDRIARTRMKLDNISHGGGAVTRLYKNWEEILSGYIRLGG
jgi:hypothetical protein